MRKISAIILSLILIMSTLAVLAVPASAEDAKVEIGKVAADYKPAEGAIAVNTAEEFAAMAADGNYYLAADIEINAAYEAKFTGTFDGCGKTIKTTAPVFKEMNGTFKNVTIDGKIEKGILVGQDSKGNDLIYAGAAVAWPTGTGVVIDNICNNADVTCVSTAGGIVGYAKDKSEVTITNCVNNGDITSGGQTGGIVGYSQGKLCTVKNCVNTGKITATSSYGAGVVGRFGKDKSKKDYVLTIENCVNTGAVESTKDQSAGVIAYIVGIGSVKDCVNKGDVSNKAGASGGILGQTASSGKVTGFTVDNCVNYGKITGTSKSAGIAASLGRDNATAGFKFAATNCINFGEIVLNATGFSTKPSDPEYTGTSNHVGGVVAYAWGGSTDNATTGNINFGNITVKASEALENQNDTIYVAGVLGYVNSSKYHIKNNVNFGTITVENVKNLFLTQIFFNNNAEGGNTDYVAGNSAIEVAGEGVVYEKNGTQAVSSTVFTAEQVASGALAADYNEKVGKKVLYQEVGKDSLPTITPVVKIDKDGKEVIVNDVIKGEDGKISNPTYVPGGSTPTPTPTPTATGDSTVIMMVVFALATVAGLALVFVPKKKEN